jgi:hypothetical protein
VRRGYLGAYYCQGQVRSPAFAAIPLGETRLPAVRRAGLLPGRAVCCVARVSEMAEIQLAEVFVEMADTLVDEST